MKKKIIRLTESELRNIVRNSVGRILKEDAEGGRYVFYSGENDENEFWDEAGINPYDFSMREDEEVASFHRSPEGYILYHEDDEFGEVWYDRSLRCFRGVSDDDMFNGYKVGFEGMTLDDIFEDVFEKVSDALLNDSYGDDEDDYDYEDDF